MRKEKEKYYQISKRLFEQTCLSIIYENFENYNNFFAKLANLPTKWQLSMDIDNNWTFHNISIISFVLHIIENKINNSFVSRKIKKQKPKLVLLFISIYDVEPKVIKQNKKSNRLFIFFFLLIRLWFFILCFW